MLATWALHGQSFIYLVARQHLAEPHYFKSVFQVVHKVILSSINFVRFPPAFWNLRHARLFQFKSNPRENSQPTLFSNSWKTGYCRSVWLTVRTSCASFAALSLRKVFWLGLLEKIIKNNEKYSPSKTFFSLSSKIKWNAPWFHRKWF